MVESAKVRADFEADFTCMIIDYDSVYHTGQCGRQIGKGSTGCETRDDSSSDL